MNRYQFTLPRTSFGLAAIALSAITFGVLVVAPASVISDRNAAAVLSASKAGVSAPREIAIVPARIDVVGEREKTMAFEPARRTLPGADQPG